MARPDHGWAMAPQDARDRTCEYTGSPLFSVFHTFRVARAPDPETTTVTRTYEATVEWTSQLDLPAWLGAVAENCTPYPGNRFGDEDGDPALDGRFRAAPVDATVRPETHPDPTLSDPYHYWNTPLGRLKRDDHYPEAVGSLTVDLVDGPDALWTADSTAGPAPNRLPAARDAYARVGLEFVGRERVRRPRADRTDREGWRRIGESSAPRTDPLAAAVSATLAPSLESHETASAVSAIRAQIDAVRAAFEFDGEGDPYRIPDRAVEAATSDPDEFG